MLNGCTIYASSRTQKVASLSSAEAELHSLVSSAADGIYMKGCLEFLLNATVDASSKVKGLSKALMSILAAGRLDGVQGFIEDENGVCYEKDFKEILVYKETFGLEHSWTLTLWMARIASLEEANVNAAPWRENIEAMARRMDTYADVLWEGLVENGGCLLREREDMIRQTRWTELDWN